jgi:hypothetical protein
MKSRKKITRLQLDDFHADEFITFGLVSSDPDYKLSLAINKKLKISLKNNSPVSVPDNQGNSIVFSRFSFVNDSGTVYNLFSNRTEKRFLLRKLMNFDYIFHVYDPVNEINIDSLSAGLKETDSTTAVFSIDINKIKDKNLHYLNK